MRTALYASLFVLCASLTPSASAQGLFGQTTPPTRPYSTDPRISLYYTPGSGLGLLFQPNLAPYGAFSQQTATQQGTGLQGQQQQQQFGTQGTMGTPATTGHPIAFASYSQYFSNLGGSTGRSPGGVAAATTPSRTPSSSTTTAAGIQAATPGSRTGPSMTNPNRMPQK